MSNEMPEKTQDGGPAFPLYDHHCNGQQFLASVGMTLRDYFAAKAMQGLLAQSCGTAFANDPAYGAAYAYVMADAMLAARQEQPK